MTLEATTQQPATARNWHSIIGPNGMCECGVQPDGSYAHCADLLKGTDRGVQDAAAQQSIDLNAVAERYEQLARLGTPGDPVARQCLNAAVAIRDAQAALEEIDHLTSAARLDATLYRRGATSE